MNERLEDLLSKHAQHRPDACAIVDQFGHFDFAQVDQRSTRIAEAFVADGLRAGGRVCLLLPKSAAAIVTILAVLKSGGVYVPLDVMSPALRLVRMIRAMSPCWLIAAPAYAGLVSECLDTCGRAAVSRLYWLGELPNETAEGTPLIEGDVQITHAALPRPGGRSSDEAVILFTSGSTGEPKGVSLTHEAVSHFVSWSNAYFKLGPNDRVSCHPPLNFDASVWDIFRAFSAEAELHLVPPRVNLLPKLLAEFIRDSKLTQWDSVPSVLTAMASHDVVAYGDFPHLRHLIWYGEVFPTKGLRYWMERLPHVQFTNTYGPTETTITASYYTVPTLPDDGVPVPLGKAIPGKQLAVFDTQQRLQNTNLIGELYIGGVGLSPGYWRDPVKTATAFVEIPAGSGHRWYRTGDLASIDDAGIVRFHGRADRQIKLRGNRIELDEVAAALSRLPGLAECAVLAIPVEGFEGTRICAAYVPLPRISSSPADLRRKLSTRLPPYMLPRQWLALDVLPKNQNGKIDYGALRQRFLAEEQTYVRTGPTDQSNH